MLEEPSSYLKGQEHPPVLSPKSRRQDDDTSTPSFTTKPTSYHTRPTGKNTEFWLGVRRFCRQKIWKNRSAKAMSKMLEK